MYAEIQRIASVNRGSLIVIALMMAVVTGFMARAVLPYIVGSFRSPQPVTLEEISSETLALPAYSIQIDAEITYYDGYLRNEGGSGVIRYTRYYALAQLGGSLLLIYTDTPPNDRQTIWIGTLQRLERQKDRDIVAAMVRDIPPLSGRILPYVLNITDMSPFTRWGVFGIFGCIAALSGAALYMGVQAAVSPREMRIWRGIRRYGEDVAATIADIEHDTRRGHLQFGYIRLTHEWVYFKSPVVFFVMRIADIVWIVPDKGFTGQTTRGAQFYDKYGVMFRAYLGHPNTEALLREIDNRVPWARFGASKVRRWQWRRDRQAFLADVALRRRIFFEQISNDAEQDQ